MKCKTVAPEKYDTVEFEFFNNTQNAPFMAKFKIGANSWRIFEATPDMKIGEALDNLQDFLVAATDTYERNNL